MKVYKYLTILLLPAFAFASESGETDILWRTINFLIFAGLLYYLLASKVKIFFVDRKNSIAKRLDSIQQKLKESRDKKDMAIAKVEEANANAKAIAISSEKETDILISRINEELNLALENMEKSQKEQMEIEKRKMIRQVVNDVLDELFKKSATSIDKQTFINIIMKKVA